MLRLWACLRAWFVENTCLEDGVWATIFSGNITFAFIKFKAYYFHVPKVEYRGKRHHPLRHARMDPRTHIVRFCGGIDGLDH